MAKIEKIRTRFKYFSKQLEWRLHSNDKNNKVIVTVANAGTGRVSSIDQRTNTGRNDSGIYFTWARLSTRRNACRSMDTFSSSATG